MEVTKGYRQTDIGILPKDWDCGLLDENSHRGSGHTPNKKIKEYYDGGIVWVSLADSDKLDRGYINSSAIKISKKGISNSSATLHPKGVVLMSRDAGIGKSAVAECELCVSQHFITWFCNEKTLHNWFLYFWLQYQKKEFERIAMGSTIKTIGLPFFRQYKVPLPKYTEQTAIATALSDTDALITSLENLIAKKRNIKQGAMQELLKPKKGWVVKKLGELGKVYGGLSGKSKEDFLNGKYPYISFMNIMNNPIIDVKTFGYVNIGVNESQNRAIKGDLFFNGSSETPEEVGMCSILQKDVSDLFLNSFCFGYRLNKVYETSGLYLCYFFRSTLGRELFFSMAQGATRYNLSKSNFNSLSISLPPSEEQRRIASIFFDIDMEIEALISKLVKYKQIKFGMMQNLLTGKIRLA